MAGERPFPELRHVSDVSEGGVERCRRLPGRTVTRLGGLWWCGHVPPCAVSHASHTSAPSRPRERTSMALARAQARTSAVEGPAAMGLSSNWGGLMRLMAAGSVDAHT